MITPSFGNKPSQLCSKRSAKSAINTAADNQSVSHTMKLYNSAKDLRALIQDNRHHRWKFDGSLEGSLSEGVPELLGVFVQWVIQGPRESKLDGRNAILKRKATLISQQIIQSYASNRQVNYKSSKPTAHISHVVETPPAVGISVHSHQGHRSRKDIDFLHAANVGVPYQRVNEINTQIASAVLKVMDDGVYIPPGLKKGVPIRGSADNIDTQVDTYDGRNSFHGTAVSVYQRISPDSVLENLSPPLKLEDNPTNLEELKSAPPTVVKMKPRRITGTPKPSTSPHYENFKLGQNRPEVDHAHQTDMAWLIVRYMQREESQIVPHTNSSDQSQTIPVWRAYNSAISPVSPGPKPLDKPHTLHCLSLMHQPMSGRL